MDQAGVEARDDVLVYSTAPLEQDTELTGPVKLILWAASSARDTDFTGKLVDAHPDGKAYNLCDGIVRAQYRNGQTSLRPSNLEKPRSSRLIFGSPATFSGRDTASAWKFPAVISRASTAILTAANLSAPTLSCSPPGKPFSTTATTPPTWCCRSSRDDGGRLCERLPG